MRIWRDFTFDAAHWLPLVPEDHKCRRMHGHTYRVRIHVMAPKRDDGMVMDFAEIGAAWRPLHERLDHRCLNDVIENPTAENLAQWIFDQLPFASNVEVWETPTSGAACS